MAVTASATPSLNISYRLSQTSRKLTAHEEASIGYTAFSFGDGTGIGGVNFGLRQTGLLPSGGSISIDLQSITKHLFNTGINVNFSDVKGVIFTNSSTTDSATPPYFNIVASGVDGFSGLFNSGSGDIRLRPQSTWSLTNYQGISTGPTDKKVSLIDSGSGIGYEFLVVGVTG